MRKFCVYILFILLGKTAFSQQLAQYSQFTLNKYAYNPAAAGTSLKSPYDILMGTRRQWLNIDNAPRTNFIYFNYTFIPQRSYRKWHNAGIYIDQDQLGIFKSNSIYASYTFHMVLSSRLIASVGVFAGVKRFYVSLNSLDSDDPAVMKSSGNLYVYPDISPGFRLYSKRFFFDLSVKQITTPRLKNSKREIGKNSQLPPHLFMSFGRKFGLGDNYILTPAINLHSVFTSIPSVELNVMLNYRSAVGVGLGVRNNSSLSGILQVRFLKNAVIGIAYDYSINRLIKASPNTLEFMLGITPLDPHDKFTRSSNVAKCPALDF
jgi:type IX secretion system PorP/SprF family membrane protein